MNTRMRMGCMSECRHFCHHISPFDTARQPQREPSVDRREHTLDSRVWAPKAGMKLRAEEDKNGAGRLQGQAESSYPLFSAASLVLATLVIAATKQKNKKQLKEGSVYSGSQPPFQQSQSCFVDCSLKHAQDSVYTDSLCSQTISCVGPHFPVFFKSGKENACQRKQETGGGFYI